MSARRRTRVAAVLLALVAAPFAHGFESPVAPSPVGSLELTIDAGTAAVGDTVPATLAVTLPSGAPAPRWPAWGEHWGETEIRSVQPTRRTQILTLGPDASARAGGVDGTRFEQTLLLVAYRPGAITLPPVTVGIKIGGAERTLSSASDLTYEVASVLPSEGGLPAPWPSDPPRPLPTPAAFVLTVATLAAAIAAVSILLWRRRRPPAAGPLTARAELLATLASLAAGADGDDDRARQTALSAAFRRYLDRRLALRATRSSSLEIERALAATALPALAASEAVALLRRCDATRFSCAAERPDGPEIAAVRTLAIRIESALDELGFTDPPQAPAATPPPSTAAGERRQA